MSSTPPILTPASRSRRRRRRHARKKRSLTRLAIVIGLASFLVIALSALLDPVTIRDARDQPAPRSETGGGGLPAAQARAESESLQAAREAERFAVDMSRPDVVDIPFKRKPRAGLLFELRSGRVLWRRNPRRQLAIASLTKMMTALLIAEREDPHERVRISRRATRTGGSGVGVLPRGKKVQLEALMNGLLLVSGNDAAVALAENSAGSVPRFVQLMNQRAHELGLSETHFTTPHGLQDRGNHSSAADLAALARADLAQRRVRRIVRRHRAIVKFPIKGGKLFLYNNNSLMRAGYRGVTGLKTGYTDRAGRSIVATAKRGKRQLGVVLLHSYNPAAQATKLLDRGFKSLQTLG
jgi:D-alanyl-D-alanine carboxypeptidase (penicillin-binding protein 5/6)